MRESLATLINLEPGLKVCGLAASAREALESIAASLPDLVLVDLKLNDGMGGLRLLEEVQETYPSLRTIAISGHSAATYRKLAIQAGARAFIDKKDATTKLIPTIRDVLSGNNETS